MKPFEKLCLLIFLTNVDCRLREQYRPCGFNPLCTCTNGGPDLGSVRCHNVPFVTMPSQINNAAAYIMSFKSNELSFLEDNGLNGTGLWKLQINNNLLTDMPTNALAGLERTLSILDLSDNHLVRIPKEALQNLDKINSLNLAGNKITFIHNDDLKNIGKTLKVLDLAKNSLMHIQTDAFRYMQSLEVLNLAYNALLTVDDIGFQGALSKLKQIILMGNMLEQIPLNLLSNLKNIKVVNLNENLISAVSEGRELRSRISLDELHLEYNLIGEITAETFRLFNQINRVYLKGNPLSVINDTFIMANVTEIYMPHCTITNISRNAFYGVAHSLSVLDLGYNELKEFPLLPLTKLNKLMLTGNQMNEITSDNIKLYASSLKYLDIAGNNMKGLSQESMKKLSNLRTLSFNKRQSVINWEYLKNVGPSMESLLLMKSSIKTLVNGAFQQLNGLKYLDLSFNSISKIENTTFKDVRHSLEKLSLHSALRMSVFPNKELSSLTKLEYLDVSSNRLIYLPHESFASMQSLKLLDLNYNNLRDLDLSFVSDTHNPNLQYLKIAFNKITAIKSHAFRNLQNIIILQLNDNLIKVIKKAAFLDLDCVVNIRLEGNQIETIENEAFLNLPTIQKINLGYNKLTSLNLAAFNQVGRLSTLRVNVDHNNIENLTSNYTGARALINIKDIDFSYNNISYIDKDYFDPVRLSIAILTLSNNKISNLTNHAFSDMVHLQKLILSNNEISVIEEKEFEGMGSVQIIDLSQNRLEQLPDKLFEAQKMLRVLSLAHNNLEKLQKGILENTIVEQIYLSNNNFQNFPEEALLQVNRTLQLLDISDNHIKSIHFEDLKVFQSLRHLNLARNKLFLPSTSEELSLSKLMALDLSYNSIKELPKWISNHLPKTLEHLNLANTSLTSFPILNDSNVILLNISSNFIQSLEAEALEQLKKLQTLDISNNKLISTNQNALSNLQQLKSLYLQENPIKRLLNTSFSNMEQLQELFLKDLELTEIHLDVFHPLTALRKLEVDSSSQNKIKLSELLKKNQGINELHIHVQETEIGGSVGNHLPKSLKSLTLEGKNLKYVEESLLSKLRSHYLTLDIRNSNITRLPQKLFQSIKGVQNISVSLINNKIQSMEMLMPNEVETPKLYLKELRISGNNLYCSCELSWIWEWLQEYEYENKCEEHSCEVSDVHDLRETKCVNWNNKSIIDVFKTDLDCFSSGVRSSYTVAVFFILITVAFSNYNIFYDL